MGLTWTLLPGLGLALLFWIGWWLWSHQRAAGKRATENSVNLCDYLREAVLLIGSDGDIRYANATASHLLGYDTKELVGLSVEHLVPEDQRHHHAHWRSAFATSGASRALGQLGPLTARHKSGRNIPVRIQLASLPGTVGKPRSVLATLYPGLDNEAVLEQVQHDVGIGTWEWDIETDQLSWSRNVFTMFGLEPDKFHASFDAYLQVVHPDDRARVAHSVNESQHNGEPYQIEYRILRYGEVRQVLERNYIHRDSEGVLRHMWGSVIDVTEQRRTQAHLQLSEAVFHHCAEGILVFDAAQQLVRSNPALNAMIGDEELEPMPQSAREILLDPESLTPVSLSSLLAGDTDDADEWRGELRLKQKAGGTLPVLASLSVIGDVSETRQYVLICSDIRQLKEQEAQLRELAMHDGLTGLPNRRLFVEHLEQALTRNRRTQARLAVVYADLDGFKQVNDRYGHEAGDKVLCQIAAGLQGAVRDSDLVARIGGDEFALLLPDCGDNAALSKLLDRVIRDGASTYRDITVTLSLGAACAPDQGADGTKLLVLADKTMYRAKHSGKNHFLIADTEPSDYSINS